jgi:hypothetical protein
VRKRSNSDYKKKGFIPDEDRAKIAKLIARQKKYKDEIEVTVEV